MEKIMENTEITTYSTVKEVSQDIYRISDLAEILKNLYFNIETADPNVILKYENEFAETKMDIIEWLKEPQNYEIFKASPDAKQALFFKQVQEGYYNHEIGIDTSLKDKIYRDFLQKYNLTPPEELMTEQEKRNFKMLQQNSNDEENSQKSGFVEEAKFLFNVYARTRIFEGNWQYVKDHLPGKDLLDNDTLVFLKTIEQNPHFLQDSPNHFLKNQGTYKDQAPTLEDFFNATQESSLGSPEAKEKIKKYNKMFKDFLDKKPEKEVIETTRKKANPAKKQELNLPKPSPLNT